jgi:hypothetical protein
MVTRFEKSSKLRNGQEYLLLWRVAKVVGQRTVDRALEGNVVALDKIEDFAWKGRKKPALVKWVAKQRKQVAKAKH